MLQAKSSTTFSNMSLKSESSATVAYDGSLVQWMEHIIWNWFDQPDSVCKDDSSDESDETNQILKRIHDSGKEEINQVVCFPETPKLFTPLTVAIKLGSDVSVIDALLDKGANVHFRDEKNGTCLHLACKTCVDINVLTLLIKKGGADYTAIDDKGRNCLMDAAANHYSECCEYLLHDCQMNPNQQDREGNTVLHYCIRGNKSNDSKSGLIKTLQFFLTMEVLMKYGSDPSLKNNMGQDAVDFAAIYGKYRKLKHFFPEALIADRNEKYENGST